MTGVPLDLGEVEAETSTPSTTSIPVVPTPSLAEGLPSMRMIPTPGSRTTTPAETTTDTPTEDDEPPPPEPDPMPWPPVDNPLPEGEEEDVALEEELARQVGRVYLRWDGGNCWNKVRKGTTKISWVFENYYRWFVPQFSTAPDHAVRFWWDRWRAVELGRTPTHSEVFARTHTRREDREWVDKRSSDVNDAYEAELKRLQDERQAAID
ncbi:hypothetical protein PIB30_103504, partial [Stylosanthes scabra]|nr:hypothetical protein [Stylosanthes scabra]